MNELLHLKQEDHAKIFEIFMSKRLSTGSPKLTLNNNSLLEESPSKELSPLKNSFPETQEKKNSKLLKYKNHIIQALENKQTVVNSYTKGTTIISESIRKRADGKNYSDLKNLPPVVYNNIKMFINKMKRIGYLNDLSVLKPYDLKIINDRAYYEREEETQSFNIRKRFWQFHSFITKKFNSLTKFLKIKKMQLPVIHPYSQFKLCWDLVICILTIFLLFYIPLSLSFGFTIMEEISMKSYVTIFLIIDMALEMNTLYFNYGLEVRNRSKIYVNYLKSYFLPDFIALFSNVAASDYFDFIDPSIKIVCGLLFYTKIFALGKFSSKMMNRFQLTHEWKGVKRLIFLFFVIIMITHLTACGWYYVGIHAKVDDPTAQTWIKTQGLASEDWYLQYMSSFYWAIVTVMTVGYGDIIPQNNSERCFCLFVILFGGMILPYSINSIGLIIQDIQRDQKKFE